MGAIGSRRVRHAEWLWLDSPEAQEAPLSAATDYFDCAWNLGLRTHDKTMVR